MNNNVLKNGKTEIWAEENNWTEKVLEPMGKADYTTIKQAVEDDKEITYRYIVENYYKEGIHNSGSRITYSQIFIDGENAGYFEDNPDREYKKLEDGRTIAIGEPTIYFDIILEPNNIHRCGSVYVWIRTGETRGETTIKTILEEPILTDDEHWELEIEVNNKLIKAIEQIKKANPKETYVAVNPNRKAGEPYAIAYIENENNPMDNEQYELYCYTIGEVNYLEQNVPNITFNEKTSFYDDPVNLFCNAFFIQDKKFEMRVDCSILPCKIEDKKLYYQDGDDWKEAIQKTSNEQTGLFGYDDYSGHRKMRWAVEHCGTDLMLAVMSDYESFYCKGQKGSYGDNIQLRYGDKMLFIRE